MGLFKAITSLLIPKAAKPPEVQPLPVPKPEEKDDRLDPDGIRQAKLRAKAEEARKGRSTLRIPLASDAPGGVQIV